MNTRLKSCYEDLLNWKMKGFPPLFLEVPAEGIRGDSFRKEIQEPPQHSTSLVGPQTELSSPFS